MMRTVCNSAEQAGPVGADDGERMAMRWTDGSSGSGWERDGAPARWFCALPGGYRLWVHAPPHVDKDAPLPMLWVLDGASLLAPVASAVDWLSRRPDASGVGPMLVAGIDHESPDRARRFRDLSFGPGVDPAGQVSDVPWGGGPAFADLLGGPARDLVTDGFAPAAHLLLGHSMGGLFALHLMAERPGAFAVTGAMSPSLWWDRAAVEAAVSRDLGGSLFLGAGSHEEPEAPASEAERRRRDRQVVTNVRRLAERLGGSDAFRIETRIAQGEDHASALTALLPAFLRFATAALAPSGQTVPKV